MTPEIEALIAEARDPNTSRDRLWELLDLSNDDVRRALLDNPNVCPTNDDGTVNTIFLNRLAEVIPEDVEAHPVFHLHAFIEPVEEMTVVAATIASRTTNKELILQLVKTFAGQGTGFLRSVVLNPHAPEEVLEELAKDKREMFWEVRKNIAKNPGTPARVLWILGDPRVESESTVRASVAENPSTPEDLLKVLGNQRTEPSMDVRFRVVMNEHVTREVLSILADASQESNAFVQAQASSKLRKLIEQ